MPKASVLEEVNKDYFGGTGNDLDLKIVDYMLFLKAPQPGDEKMAQKKRDEIVNNVSEEQ